MLPGYLASRAMALLFCQHSAGSVGDSGLRFRRLWGFGWVSCGLGFLGSRLILPRQQSQAFSCYESHIVWPSPGWGGGSLGHWGASSYSPGLNPPSGPPWPLPLPRAHSAPPFPTGARNGSHRGEDLGRKEWRREQRKWISRGRMGEWERSRRPRKRGGARDRERAFPGLCP